MARLRARWYLVAIAVIVAVLVAGASLYRVGSGGLTEKKSYYSVARAQLLIDSDPSTLTNITAGSASATLAARAPYIAEYATSPSVARSISTAFGHPVRIQAAVKSAGVGVATNSPGSQVSTGSGSDTVVLQATSSSPTIQISADATSPSAARALTASTIHALRRSLTKLQKAQDAVLQTTTSTTSTSTSTAAPGSATGTGTSPSSKAALTKIVLRSLGAVDATTVVATPKKSKAILYGVGTLVVLLLVILLVDNAVRGAGTGRGHAARASSAAD